MVKKAAILLWHLHGNSNPIVIEIVLKSNQFIFIPKFLAGNPQPSLSKAKMMKIVRGFFCSISVRILKILHH